MYVCMYVHFLYTYYVLDATIAITFPSARFCHEIVSDQDDARYFGGSWALVFFYLHALYWTPRCIVQTVE